MTFFGAERQYNAGRWQPTDGRRSDNALGKVIPTIETRERVRMYEIIVRALISPNDEEIVAFECDLPICALRIRCES